MGSNYFQVIIVFAPPTPPPPHTPINTINIGERVTEALNNRLCESAPVVVEAEESLDRRRPLRTTSGACTHRVEELPKGKHRAAATD